jgi:DNA-binding transcriptional regulator LsrR (DeoR family)
MRKIREVMRLKYDRGLSHRQISAAVGISRSSVSEYLDRAERTGLTWEIAQTLSDAEVEQRLFHYLGRHEGNVPLSVETVVTARFYAAFSTSARGTPSWAS